MPNKNVNLAPNLSNKIPPIYININIDISIAEIVDDSNNGSLILVLKKGTIKIDINETLQIPYIALLMKNFFG